MNKTLGQDSAAAPVSRRLLFAGAGTAGALAVAATVLPKAPAAAVATPVAQAGAAEGGYQLTEHVLRYYQTARV